ncbi:APC family permease [Sphingobacterium corticibacterium]|uniref:Amino acid permease n=1 Tax=Sphingobacterium corticibacterium TaxID=2484746 RepID=A0A4Q6XPM2_9SPHI|nr:amino acid permease [Sphingobacterium corticibacterium]RZF61861.1 amino acid permease [Sphingobacterium corticibacterium]
MKDTQNLKTTIENITEANSNGAANPHKSTHPKQVLSVIDAIVVIVGIVVGAGIFRTPSIVAANTGSSELFFGVWVLGGVISLIGAMCYAELSTAFPNTGGDYHFLHRAFGRRFAFLFAWARMSIIQTGSIALLAFIVGDYMSELYSLGTFSSSIYAAIVVIGLTLVNIIGVHVGTGAQKLLVSLQFIGLFVLIVAGLFFAPESSASTTVAPVSSGITAAIGGAMVMVLLTFGGWNEAGYISSEMRGGSKKMALVMIASILIITVIYLLINMAYLHVLGIDGLASSEAVGVETMRVVMGDTGVFFIGLLVILAALTSTNATIFTGARTNHALGRDFSVFSFMRTWKSKTSTPVNALVTQGVIAIFLIIVGSFARSGFESMVDFTAPIFWFFILCTGVSLFVLRYKEPHAPRPFKVPLYPVLPIIFCLTSIYLLYSSLMFAGRGAWLGVGVLLLGTVFFFFIPKSK